MPPPVVAMPNLKQCLGERAGSLKGLAHRFQKRLAKLNEAPWLMATGEDFRYRETVGGTAGSMTKFMHRYMDHVIRLSTRSVGVRTVLMRAFNLLVPPTALFRPRVLVSSVISNVQTYSFTCRLKTRMKTRTEITLEMDRWLVVSRPGRRGRISWCSNCSSYIEMLSVDEAALVADVNSRTIFRWVESGALHSSETREGLLLICPHSPNLTY